MTDGDTIAFTEPRALFEPLALTLNDVVDDAARRADAYGDNDVHGVAVVDGFGARVIVERGHLELHDGVGEHRRVRRYSKIEPPVRLVVGVGTVGVVSLDAIRWCANLGVPVSVLGGDGTLLTASPQGRSDARLLRAQALALYGPAGVAVTQYLITEKVRGQARVLGSQLFEDDAASTLLDLMAEIEQCDSIEEIRQREAACANVYFAAWERAVEVTFVRNDVSRVPAYWLRFNGRRSSINPGSPRSATDPCGAMANYSYRLAEIEAGMAAQRMGLDPGLGILHADMVNRASFACDLMEAVRPDIDSHVLDLCRGPLRKREFTEDARGVVRCLAPITHRLAEAMPSYAIALGPVVETVAGILAKSSPYNVTVPSVLSGAKHKAAARRRADAERQTTSRQPAAGRGPNPGGMSPRGRRRAKPPASPPLPLRACRGCGGRLPVENDRAKARTEWCPSCLAQRREEVGSALPAAARTAALRFAADTGVLPTHTAEAQAARSVSMKEQRMIEAAYEAANGVEADPTWYGATVQPLLAGFTLTVIARAVGVSTSAAAKWRAGRAIPHPRHWSALAELVGASDTSRS